MRTDLPSLPEIGESRWGFLSTLPKWVSLALPMLGAGLSSVGSLISGTPKIVLVIVGIVLAFIGLLTTLARRSQDEIERERAKVSWLSTLDCQISPLLQMLGELANTHDDGDRREQAGKIRVAAVNATARLCGADGMNGTRANLFRLEPHGQGLQMRLERGGWGGRGDRSTRVFRHGDETLRHTLDDDFRFEPQVSDSKLAYGTFLTFPISEGPQTVFGVLTIDCARPGDISQAEDIRIMRLMAAVITMTYLIEGAPSYTAMDDVPVR